MGRGSPRSSRRSPGSTGRTRGGSSFGGARLPICSPTGGPDSASPSRFRTYGSSRSEAVWRRGGADGCQRDGGARAIAGDHRAEWGGEVHALPDDRRAAPAGRGADHLSGARDYRSAPLPAGQTRHRHRVSGRTALPDRKRFGGVAALTDVSVTVERGQLLAIIGPNGAGKSTLFQTIAGQHRPDAGRIIFRGREITDLLPYRRARLGIAIAFQDVRLFPIGSGLAAWRR